MMDIITKMKIICMLLIVYIILPRSINTHISIFDEKNKIRQDGNLISVMFLPLCLNEKTKPENALIFTELLKHVTSINNQNISNVNKHLNNIAFGYIVHDTCRMNEEDISKTFLYYLIDGDFNQDSNYLKTQNSKNESNSFQQSKQNKTILAFIGDMSYRSLEFGINILLPYKYLFVTLSLESPEMSKERTGMYLQPMIIHLERSDNILIELFQIFKWNYTAIIVSTDDREDRLKNYLTNKLNNINACISFTETFDNKNNKKLQNLLLQDSSPEVVFVWLEHVQDYQIYFEFVEHFQIYNKTWIVNDYMSSIPDIFLKKLNPYLIHGTLVLSGPHSNLSDLYYKDFSNSFWNLTLDRNETFMKAFKQKYAAEQKNTAASIRDFKVAFPSNTIKKVNMIMKTMKTFQYNVYKTLKRSNDTSFAEFKAIFHAQSTQSYKNYFWPFTSTIDTTIYILNVVNKTINRVEVAYHSKNIVRVNKRDRSSMIWAGYQKEPLRGQCSEICQPGMYPIFMYNKTCCWYCQSCPHGLYKNKTSNENCIKCPLHNKANIEKTKCLIYRDIYIEFHSITTYKILGISGIGVFITASIFSIIILYKDTPVVRSANFPLTIIQLICHIVIFLHPISYIGETAMWKCELDVLARGVGFTFIIAVVFSKTNYLLEIFRSNGRTSRKQVLLRKYKQYFIIVMFVTVQTCIYILHITIVPITIQDDKYPTMHIITCDNRPHILVQRCFCEVWLIFCTILAFKTRKLPENFNEAKLIFYGTFLVSLIGVTLFFFRFHHNIKFYHNFVIVDQLVDFTLNMIILSFVFVHKVFIVLFQPEKNTTQALKKSTFKAMQKLVLKQINSNK